MEQRKKGLNKIKKCLEACMRMVVENAESGRKDDDDDGGKSARFEKREHYKWDHHTFS